MSSYTSILEDPLWHHELDHTELPQLERVRLTYERARIMCRHVDLSVNDILNLSPKFWKLHQDPRYSRDRQDLQVILGQLQDFSVCGEFMLTELGRGLDARHLETTATMQPDGSFVLNTPSQAAAKVMPPTTPLSGMPRIAVVFAKLLVGAEDRGIKPFLVRLHDANNMCPGVSSRMLPKRPGARLVDHAITSFANVQLAPASLLGGLEKAANERTAFFELIERVAVGSFSLSASNIPTLRLSSYIAGRYSQRRTVTGPKAVQIPIVKFSTQLRPVLAGLTQANIFEVYADHMTSIFHSQEVDRNTLGALATVYKATVIHASQLTYNELIDRCGWQGLFGYNQISENALAQRGNSIAEGDVLVLCIKLANELMLGRQHLPEAVNPDSLLAKHEAGVWEEALEAASKIQGSHRDEAFNNLLLPRCRYLIQVIGQRMAYEAGTAAIEAVEKDPSIPCNLTRELLHLYEVTCMMYDESWFVQHAGFTRDQLIHREADAFEAVKPHLDQLLEDTGAEPWVSAPILTEERWGDFVARLRCFKAPVQPQNAVNWLGRVLKVVHNSPSLLTPKAKAIPGLSVVA